MEASVSPVQEPLGIRCTVSSRQRGFGTKANQVGAGVCSRLPCLQFATRRGMGMWERPGGIATTFGAVNLGGRILLGSGNNSNWRKGPWVVRTDRKSGSAGLETEEYRLREGEWVAEVADKLGVRLRDIQALNPTINVDRVFARQVITVPKTSKWSQEEDSDEAFPDLKPSVQILDSSNPLPSEGTWENEVTPPNFAGDVSQRQASGTRDSNGREGSNQNASTGSTLPETTSNDDSRDQIRGELEYMVQPGDYLADIASRHGVKLKSLIALNKLNYEDRIRVGQILVIPPEEIDHIEVHRTSQQSVWQLLKDVSSDPFFQTAALVSAIFVASAIILLNVKKPPKTRRARSLVSNDAPVLESGAEIPERSLGLRLPFGRSHYTRQLEAAARLIATNIEATFDSPDGMKVGEGFATGKSQREAIEAAYSGASSSLNGMAPTIGFLSLSSATKSKITADIRAKEAVSSLTRLMSEGNHCLSGVMTLGGGGFLSLADLQSKAGSLGNWAALLLFGAPNDSILVSSVEPGVEGLRGTVQAAAKALVSKLDGNMRLKAVVAHGSGSIARAVVLNELSATFPSVSCYEVRAAGDQLQRASDWQLHIGGSSSTNPDHLSQGLILFGVTTSADFGGAFFATVMCQWLYGKHGHVAAKPPKPKAS